MCSLRESEERDDYHHNTKGLGFFSNLSKKTPNKNHHHHDPLFLHLHHHHLLLLHHYTLTSLPLPSLSLSTPTQNPHHHERLFFHHHERISTNPLINTKLALLGNQASWSDLILHSFDSDQSSNLSTLLHIVVKASSFSAKTHQIPYGFLSFMIKLKRITQFLHVSHLGFQKNPTISSLSSLLCSSSHVIYLFLFHQALATRLPPASPRSRVCNYVGMFS